MNQKTTYMSPMEILAYMAINTKAFFFIRYTLVNTTVDIKITRRDLVRMIEEQKTVTTIYVSIENNCLTILD